MKELSANSIRVYHVDPAADHDGCMAAFADAGIYLWLDLDTFDTQIEQGSPHWNDTQLHAFSAVMDAFHTYDNLGGFFVGNEVLTKPDGSPAAPFVKAAARDTKAYRDEKGYRNIPIGYSAADIASLRPMLQNYLACGRDAAQSLDFFGLNAYEWCGESTFPTSGYAELTRNASGYSIPIFLSETGCITARPRTFADQAAVFSPDMAPVWSGAIVYEWIEEANNYGLVRYGDRVPADSPNAPPDGFPRSGVPAPVQPDFDNLSAQWAAATPSGVSQSAYDPSGLKPPACPAFMQDAWEVEPDAPLPSLGATYDPNASGPTGTGGGEGGAATAAPTETGGATGLHVGPAWGPGREVQVMGVALFGVLAGAFMWL